MTTTPTSTDTVAGPAATEPAPLRIAGAPISWGVCEVLNWGYQLSPDRVLNEMRDIGLAATELGPDGFLPADPDQSGSSVSLCLDTGHLLIGGTDPADLTRQAPERIAHTHLKDVDSSIADKVRAGRLSYTILTEEPRGEGPLTDVRTSADHVRSLLAGS